MASYVRQRLAEIKANPELRQRPVKSLSRRERVAVAARWIAILGQRKRLWIVMLLMDGERTVTDLVSRVGGTQISLSQHLAVLAEQGIVESRAEGTWRYYSCKSEEAKTLITLLERLAENDRLPVSGGYGSAGQGRIASSSE